MSNEPAAPRATFKEGDHCNEGEDYLSMIDVVSAHFQQSNKKITNFIPI